MNNTDKLQNKLNTIKRGAYWFGILGRLSILIGLINVSFGVFGKLTGYTGPWIAGVVSGTSAIIYGYLFLLGRDGFEVIAELIWETAGPAA